MPSQRNGDIEFSNRGRQPTNGTDNPAIALMAVVGSNAPPRVTINEFTTVASVWTHAQFLAGAAVEGHALGLSIAAGNVANFVDIESDGYGTVIAARAEEAFLEFHFCSASRTTRLPP